MKWPNGLSWNGYGPWEWIPQGAWGPSLMQLGLGFQPGPYPSSWAGPNSNSITCLDWAPTQAQIKSKPKNTKFPHSLPLQPPPGHHHQNPLCPRAHRQPHRRLHRSPTSHHPLSRSTAHAHLRVPALVAEDNGPNRSWTAAVTSVRGHQLSSQVRRRRRSFRSRLRRKREEAILLVGAGRLRDTAESQPPKWSIVVRSDTPGGHGDRWRSYSQSLRLAMEKEKLQCRHWFSWLGELEEVGMKGGGHAWLCMAMRERGEWV